jgi:hypothetical protein
VFYSTAPAERRAVSTDYVAFTKGEVKGKTSSLTALPIIETRRRRLGFVPTT